MATDVWVRIFVQLLPHIHEAAYPWYDRWTTATFARDQARFHKLKLVCTRFNAILQNAQLPYATLAVALPISNNSGLGTWLRLHGGRLENLLLTTTGKGAEAPVATLAKLGSALTTVRWGNFDKHALVALDIFSITSLSLWSPDQAVMDLGPLRRLPDLQKLYLSSGSYTVDGLPKHLTSLNLRLCDLTSAGSTQGKHLKKLSIVYSTFSGYKFDEDELLEELKISESCVKVDDAGDDFANANPSQGVNLTEHKLFCGADLSHLKKLRVLKLMVANWYTRYGGTSLMFDSLYFCYQLPLLEELRLESTSLHLIIGNELVNLRNLTSLTVSAARDGMAEGFLEPWPE